MDDSQITEDKPATVADALNLYKRQTGQLPREPEPSVESAASMALNKGTPPDYGRNAGHTFCYLCNGPAFEETKINWRGHWICPGCYEKEKNRLNMETGPVQAVKDKEQVDLILHPTAFTKGSDTSAHAILEEAASTITQRGKDYNKDGGERSMAATVDAFNRITGHKLSVLHGWQFMVLLKMVRIQQSPGKRDSHTDCAAYAALAGEEALNKQIK